MAYRKTLIANDMKKVFGLFLSLIVLMGLSACEPELPEDSKKPNPEESSYLTFVSSGESSVTLVRVGKPFDISLEYSLDGTNWNPYTIGETIYLLEDKLSFRAGEQGNRRLSKGIDDYYQFEVSGEVAAKGNIMSLLDRSCRKNVIPSYAFFNLFRDCTGLTKAPELPVKNLAEKCYWGMFSGCTSLTEAPALSATVLAEGCYNSMFDGCTNLTKAPELPATELAEHCYSSMFNGCTSLTKAPELPAMELAGGCYSNMFNSCTSLTKAPELPAMKLVDGCYGEMFYRCENLSYIMAFFTDKPSEKTTRNWVYGVASTGTFVKSKDAMWNVRGDNGIPKGWTVEGDVANPDELLCLTFVSSGESTIALIKEGEPSEITLEYSVNGTGWKPYTIGKTVKLADGEELMFRAGEEGNDNFSAGYKDYYKFIISGSVAARGNIMSLLDRKCRKNAVPSYAFMYLFRDCAGLTEAPELPAAELAGGCYSNMFNSCTSLTKAPALPTMEMAASCYCQMFYCCANLTEAPVLPATKLAEKCYSNMFSGCTNLTEAPELPATELASHCYFHMFSGCTNLTEAPDLPAMKLAEWCYCCMFIGCTSLTKAPDLPATNLATGCYDCMFIGCTNLTKTPELPAMELAYGCYFNMFQGCTNLTKAPELPARELAVSCYSNMFQGCTNLTKAPDLPAIDLDKGCYSNMFSGCTNLNYIKALFTDEPSKETTAGWLSNVSSTGTFVKSKDATWDVRGDDGIPEGWTVESDAGTSDDPQKPNPDEPSYLTFVSTGESTVTLEKVGEPFDISISLEYSLDGTNWNPYTIGETISLLDGEKLMFRAGIVRNKSFSHSYDRYYKFKIFGSVAAKGNIMSLLNRKCSSNSVLSYTFFNLFSDCTGLTSAPDLPATELAEFCYRRMFYGCTKLTTAPVLPAKELAEHCYSSMFRGCTSLNEAPELPATVLAERCYSIMFQGCTSLNEAPELPATVLAEYCYYDMFQNCTSLTEAPDLPATKLAERCYFGMFKGCTNLNYVKALFTGEPSESTRDWLSGVSSTGTFVKSKEAKWDVRGENGIPEGWTVVTE